MKISNKLHRASSLAAGIVMLLTILFGLLTQLISLGSIIAQLTGEAATSYIVTAVSNLMLNTVVSILMIVVLFRGKKDIVACIIFLVTALYVLVAAAGGNISSFIQSFTPAYAQYSDKSLAYIRVNLVLFLLSNLSHVALRGLIALECFKPGKLSAGGARFILIGLPILALVLSLAGSLVQAISYADGDMAYVVVGFLPVAILNIVNGIAPILMGVSFSIPVRETAPLGYGYPAPQQYS